MLLLLVLLSAICKGFVIMCYLLQFVFFVFPRTLVHFYICCAKFYTVNIINNIQGSNVEINMYIQKEILHILQTVMEQNCFQFDQQYYK
jgi:hypothetical protein